MTERINGKRLTKSAFRESAQMRNSSSKWEAGYDLHPIRLAAAKATGSKWRDGFVTAVSPLGDFEVTGLDGEKRTYWAAALDLGTQDLGTPVAINTVYDVLAIAGGFLSVADHTQQVRRES